ncbi:hypothetical protein GE09DRAFT_321101 [Coniochaeta sp. 2T2.1]|nr:hypothetical protein GE09DRAFT_321101 [Coniochaeta sp. 2T2.1]
MSKHSRPEDHFTPRHYAAKDARGPLPFLNPTRRHIPLSLTDAAATRSKSVVPTTTTDHAGGALQQGDAAAALGKTTTGSVYHVWRSRDNRKGRHAIAVTEEYAGKSALRATNSVVEVLRGVGKMFVRFPVWDVSYDVAVIYTIGSIIWCLNGFFVWLPLYRPATEFPGEVASAGGITACLGATVFEVGSVLGMLEAVNENRTDCFGWALEKIVEDGPRTVVRKREGECGHHHCYRRGLFGRRGGGVRAEGKDGPATGKGKVKTHPESRDRRRWSWCPSGYELRTHYIREIGFLANASQMVGATIFWIAGIVGVEGILGGLSTGAKNGVYWVPQVVGGTGFIISSSLFMLETQERWYIPAPKLLGWHIGFWNLVGGIGFTLCGALGLGSADASVEYASTLATFVGSWAFLLGSLIQLYESLNKYPISVVKGS